MKTKMVSIALIVLVSGCKQKPPPNKINPNAGKHKIELSDIRRWRTYPVVLLVAAKHHIGPDTVGVLVRSFEKQLHASHIYYHTEPEWQAQLPERLEGYQEDVGTVSQDVKFFAIQGQKYNLSASAIADIITDFYLIGGSNREFPEPGGEG